MTMPRGETQKAIDVSATNIGATETETRYDLEILFDKPEKWDGVGLMARAAVSSPWTCRSR